MWLERKTNEFPAFAINGSLDGHSVTWGGSRAENWISLNSLQPLLKRMLCDYYLVVADDLVASLPQKA